MKKTIIILHLIGGIALILTFYGGPPMGEAEMHPWDIGAFALSLTVIILCPLAYLCFIEKFGLPRFRNITTIALTAVAAATTVVGITMAFGWPDFLADPIWKGCVYLNSPPLRVPPDRFAGTWYFDRNLNSRKEYVWPSEFDQFCLILDPSGTFSATNIPANFFFSFTPTPAHSIDRGKWEIQTKSGQKYYHLNFIFDSPNPGYLGSSIQVRNGAFVIQLGYDHKSFYLSREEQSEMNFNKTPHSR